MLKFYKTKCYTIAFFIACTIPCISASAQDKGTNHSKIVLQAGLSKPTGKYGSKDWEQDSPAFAKQGPLFSLSYIRELGKHFALGATVAKRTHPYDEEEFFEWRGGEDHGFWIDSSEPWKSSFLLGDLYLQAPANKVTFYAKGSLGASFNRSAAFVIGYQNWTEERPAGKGNAFAYGTAAGMRVDVGPVGLGLEAGTLLTRPEFEVSHYYYGTKKIRPRMNSLNISVAIAYNL